MDSHEEQKKPVQAFEIEQADIYRTRWLMAHNRLHELLNGSDQEPREIWRAYLCELIEAERTVRKVA